MSDHTRRRSILLAALAYLAKKESDRDQLPEGATRVQGVIHATVGRATVEYPFAGQLEVGAEQQAAASSAPDPARVCAVLLGKLPAARRAGALEKIARHFEAQGELPAVADELVASVAHTLSRLRSRTTVSKRGSVVFASDLPAESAKSA
jgi:hypothetical protein